MSAPLLATVRADPVWQTVDFISDVHLQATQPAVFWAWQHYLAHTSADAVFILGDLFDVWVGDDALFDRQGAGGEASFEARCMHVLRSASQRMRIFLMHGNRDFLLGAAFAQACGITLIHDPCIVDFDRQRLLLSHGDALCLADTDYQQFRQQVRTQTWCDDFLAKPLAIRREMAADMRAQSESRRAGDRRADTARPADADDATVRQWLDAAQADTLIHGHTHLPADHPVDIDTCTPRCRRVLGSWGEDSVAHPPVLRLCREAGGASPLPKRV